MAPEFGVTIAKTAEETEATHLASGLVAHRESLNYTGRDLSQQVTANLVGSPELILEKVDGLKRLGVHHCCALMFPTDTMAEYEDDAGENRHIGRLRRGQHLGAAALPVVIEREVGERAADVDGESNAGAHEKTS